MSKGKLAVTVALFAVFVVGDDFHYHMSSKSVNPIKPALQFFPKEIEKFTDYWRLQGQLKLEKLVNEKVNLNKAKNVIMFLGDGMGIATVSATRMLLGGEEKSLSFEEFPYFGFSKTYCVDSQVADSACTSTAYLSGIKTNYEIIGLTGAAKFGDCNAQNDKNLWTESIASWAGKSCKSTGIVTTTRVTHASPAGAYAHIADRDWENDHEVSLSKCSPHTVDDIAEQLIYNEEGKRLKVILGGGRSNFRNQSKTDEEGKNGYRLDGKDLIEEWKKLRGAEGKSTYVWNKEGLLNVDTGNTDFLLGLFEDDHMRYNLDVVSEKLQSQKPSLSDMTRVAIEMLEKDENGYFLFVEGGMIDQAHHYNFAQASLDETREFSKAIEMARKMTKEEDTLIVVTADHAHVFTYNGYPARGSPIFESPNVSDIDMKPYTTLSYANGDGFSFMFNSDGTRVNPLNYNFTNHKVQYPATAAMTKETHGGQDVGVWASGPQSHLFSGHYEQNSIPLLMAHILQVGPYAVDEKCAAISVSPTYFLILISLIMTAKYLM